ncbi:hypothetical protein [Vannielia sp. SX4]|uniref:hypothetical protein n=1 Tax=Vannielia sp. SX4 TaxID=3463852 RepID=UPI00405A2852
MKQQIENGERAGVYHIMMASLIFSAFSIEAKVNFVGWKVLKNGWPERANLREKIALLLQILPLELSWGERPLQTVAELKRFRDTLAHGKPEIVDETAIVDVPPEIWDALKSQWESSVTPDFVNRCREDEDVLWQKLLGAAKINVSDTITHGGHDLKKLVEPD